jgi:hypothetical protein
MNNTYKQVTPRTFAEDILALLQDEKGANILVEGMPGVGKTAVLNKITKEAGYNLLLNHSATSDPTDPKGMPALVTDPNTMEQTAVFLPFGDLKQILDATKPLLVFFDDLGQAPALVQAAWMQLLHGGKLNGHTVPDCVRFAAATNRRKDKAGVKQVLSAVVGRFPYNVELVPDVKDWCAHAITDPWCDPIVVSFARFINQEGDPVFEFDGNKELENSCVPRTLSALGNLVRIFKEKTSHRHACGAIGEAMGIKFMAYFKLYKEMPDPDAVIAFPDSTAVPDRLDVLYALTGALAARASRKNVGNILKFSNRLPREFGVLLVKDIYEREQALKQGVCSAPEMMTWISNNHDIIFG